MKVNEIVLVTSDADWAAIYINDEMENETHSFDAADLIEWVQSLNGQPMSFQARHVTEAYSNKMYEDGNGFPGSYADFKEEDFTV